MQKNNLIIGRAIFTLFIIIAFGLIIMNEKGNQIFSKKIEQKIDEYINTNYNSLNMIKSPLTFNNSKFTMKITSNKNKNHYFTITYYKKEITDTYEKDYLQGTNLLSFLKKNIEKEIKEKTQKKVVVTPITSLDKYSQKVQERLIEEKDILNLKFYNIDTELNISNWNKEEITNNIIEFIIIMKENNITPKYYNITINNNQDSTFSIVISHITEDFVSNKDQFNIINDIITNNNSELIKESKITYKYLNEEE